MKKISPAKSILGALFTIWGGITFISTMVIILIPAWLIGILPEPKRTDIFIKLCRFWMALFYPLSFIRVKYIGREQFAKNENYIIVCNHKSMMDVPVTSPGIPGANKTIAKIEMSRIPLFGIIYKRGSILLDRKNESSRKESYNQMKWVLETGMHMCIYPEGTRNKTDQPLKSFHDGAFRLAKETGKKIIPAVLTGTQDILPANKGFYFWPGKITMKFLDPINPDSFENHTELKEYVYGVMENTLRDKGQGTRHK